jgi:hypothetical protein
MPGFPGIRESFDAFRQWPGSGFDAVAGSETRASHAKRHDIQYSCVTVVIKRACSF